MAKRRIRIVEKIAAKTLAIKIKKLFSKYSGNEPIHNYLEEYSPYHIFQMFEEGKKLFSNLINPLMYKQALSEFVKYGSFIKFPTKHVYQWMGIIMRNTAIIYHITEIVGHIDCSPLNDFIKYYFGDNDNPEDAWNAYKKGKCEDDDYSAMTDFLDNRGFFKWSKLPDSSDAWSDFGLQPLLEICLEYNENKTPEEVIVLVNRALDVTHYRGDLASAFISGGSKSLDSISNNKPREKNAQYNRKHH